MVPEAFAMPVKFVFQFKSNLMKKLLLSLSVLASGFMVSAQSVDEIVDKHIAAIGGKENWKKVNSMVMEGSLNVMGREVGVKITQVHNKGSRQDISVAGMSGYEITTPTGGWVFMPFQGQAKPEPIPAEAVKESLDDLDLHGNLVDYKEKGHTVELLGKEDVEGTECFKIKVNRKNSGEQTIFVDPDSYLIVRAITKRKAMGQEVEMKSDLSDYKEVNGVKVPFSVSQQFGTVVFSSIKINEQVDEKLFAAPSSN
jgi:hypothetical protein